MSLARGTRHAAFDDKGCSVRGGGGQGGHLDRPAKHDLESGGGKEVKAGRESASGV